MKTIEVDDDLYSYIASHTQHIGESASDILRRMLRFSAVTQPEVSPAKGLPPAVPEGELHQATPAKENIRALRELLLSDEYDEQKRAVNRFMLILTALYNLNSQGFADAARSLHGRTRVYFAEDSRILLKNGSHTKPKQIPGTSWWVITNTNTGRKCSMITHIMQAMQFPTEVIEKVCSTI